MALQNKEAANWTTVMINGTSLYERREGERVKSIYRVIAECTICFYGGTFFPLYKLCIHYSEYCTCMYVTVCGWLCSCASDRNYWSDHPAQMSSAVEIKRGTKAWEIKGACLEKRRKHSSGTKMSPQRLFGRLFSLLPSSSSLQLICLPFLFMPSIVYSCVFIF